MPYIFLGELFPPERRGVATGAVSMAQCAFNFGALKMFPYTLQVSQKTNILVQLVLKSIFPPLQSLGLVGSFLFSSGVCLAGAVVAAAAVPETEGKEQEEIW